VIRRHFPTFFEDVQYADGRMCDQVLMRATHAMHRRIGSIDTGESARRRCQRAYDTLCASMRGLQQLPLGVARVVHCSPVLRGTRAPFAAEYSLRWRAMDKLAERHDMTDNEGGQYLLPRCDALTQMCCESIPGEQNLCARASTHSVCSAAHIGTHWCVAVIVGCRTSTEDGHARPHRSCTARTNAHESVCARVVCSCNDCKSAFFARFHN
jgi:hypothetical protein